MKYRQLRNFIITLALSCLLLNSTVMAQYQNNLPDIGTSGAGTLTIAQEIEMGDYYLRQLRRGAPFIYDPLLNHYINSVGNKLGQQSGWKQTPLNFFIINNSQINAFAFFGGNVVIHSGLLNESDNESQFASVLAHEISHVTQRHLARAIEDQRRKAPLTWAGAIGSILLSIASPEAGMAALTSTIAGSHQSMLVFTQSNEQEADRIGLSLLQKAGFDPQGSPQFLQKMADKSRFSSKPPEILLTHPLPDSRLSDARNRANQLPATVNKSSLDFYLAKVRLLIMTESNNGNLKSLLNDYSKGNPDEKIAAQYATAFQLLNNKKPAEAQQTLTPLLQAQPDNIWFLDLMTDIDLAAKQYNQAIVRLETALKTDKNNPVLQINLANAYIEGNRASQAASLLHRYTHTYPSDLNGWGLLAEAYNKQKLRSEELSVRAEVAALNGDFTQAIRLLSSASSASKLGSPNQARFDARIDQLRAIQQKYQQYK